MKHAKKLASLLLVLVMAMALAVPAFAEGGNGSITINKAIPGETYKIYQIFQLEGYDAESSAYAYKIDRDSSPWMNFFGDDGAGKNYVTINAQGYVAWAENKKDDADYVAFAKAALIYAQDNDDIKESAITKTADSTTVTFDNLDLGYYLVDSSLGTLAILGTNTVDFSMDEKNEVPNVEKKVKEDSTENYGDSNTADIGQTVTFQTIITAKAGALNYTLHDTMSEGLTFQKIESVKYQKATAYNEATKTYSYGDLKEVEVGNYIATTNGFTDDCTFEVSFEQNFLDTLDTGDQIIVTYTATINENAVVGGSGNSNETKLTYGNTDRATTESTTTTYTWDIDVFKYTGNDKALAGATFTLSKDADGNNLIKLVREDNNKYRVAKSDETDVITEITTDSTGKFTIEGLDSDTYYLAETKQPDGYNKLDDPITIVIGNDGQTSVNNNQVDEVKVLNNTGSQLPTTGGMGTTIFYILGGALMVGAVVLLITKKRMDQTEK